MKILVTGAGGFLGYHICERLLKEGHEVTSFSRSHHKDLDELNIKTITGNLINYEDVEKSLKGFDAVFHVASKVAMWGKWEDFYNTNVTGTENIIKACKKHGIQTLVYTSTPSVVFGTNEIINGNEDIPYPSDFNSLYAKSKSIAEKMILEANESNTLHTCALRPHLIFGPRDKNIIPRVVDAAKKGRLKKIGEGNNMVDVIHVENAALAHIQAFKSLIENQKAAGKAYFIAQEEPVNLWDFINTILAKHKIDPITKSISFKKAYRVGTVIEFFLKLFRIHDVHPPMTKFVAMQMSKSHYFSHKRAENDFGYKPEINLDQALNSLAVGINK